MANSPDLTPTLNHSIALVSVQPFAWGMTPRVRQKTPLAGNAA